MEITEKRELRMTRTFKAPVDLVWKVWTDPAHLEQWWGPDGNTNTVHKMDFQEGGEWRMTMHGADGKNYLNRSIFREISPFKKIVFEHFNPHFMATVLFESKGEDTQIEWSALFDTEENFEIIVKTFKADEGQQQNFDRLEKYLANL